MVGVAFGTTLPSGNFLRGGLDCYLQSSGIETGYGFFAPNVANNSKLVFQLYHADGSTELVLPTASDASSGLRIVDLLDRISEMEYPPVRELILRKMVETVWRRHPDAVRIRAIFGSVIMPTLDAFKRGERESYQTLFAYEFAPLSSGAQP